MPATPLLDWLGARHGVVALVGAGGKKTTMYRLAAEHPGPVGITTTVRMAPFPADLDAGRTVGEPGDLATRVPELAGRHRQVAYAGVEDRPGRLGGVTPELVARLHRSAGLEATYVKADGARGRWIKCPRPGEPVLPAGARTVVALASARALGQPLDRRTAHRPEACAAFLEMEEGEPLSPAGMAALLALAGARCRVNSRVRVTPVINMVDGPELEGAARETARRLLELDSRIPHVLLTAMNRPRPLVAVVGSRTG